VAAPEAQLTETQPPTTDTAAIDGSEEALRQATPPEEQLTEAQQPKTSEFMTEQGAAQSLETEAPLSKPEALQSNFENDFQDQLRQRVLNNIEDSQAARASSNFSQYAEIENSVLRGIDAPNSAVAPAASTAPAGTFKGPYATNADLVQSIATRADDWGISKGLGNGPVAGTLKHGYAEKLLTRYQDIFGSRGLTPEARYVSGAPWNPGDPLAGSIRLDVVEGPLGAPTQAWDYKFGKATLSQTRILQIRTGTSSPTLPVTEVKP
jgi:hypothetical protein